MSKEHEEEIEILPELATAATSEFQRLIDRLKKEEDSAKKASLENKPE